MTDTISYIHSTLKDIYPPEEIRSFIRLIMEHVCGIQSYQLLSDKDKELSDSEKGEIKEIIERLRQSEPIQYIIGKTCFYGYEFLVNQSTLIPRPETEELVERILIDQKEGKINLLDIGTGSGCIAITLAKKIKGSQVTAIDISKEALTTAKKNADILEVDNITFIQADILSNEQLDIISHNSYDLIVSNPPYVMISEKEGMEKNVLLHEPENALFVPDNDPLLFYRRIAQLGNKYLKPNGFLYFEINAQLGQEMITLLQNENYENVKLLKDLSGKDRISIAQLQKK